MAIYDLALPDGRTLTLEAPNEQAAMTAATDWHASNPKVDTASKGYGANFSEMATESSGQLGRGVGQLHNAWDFAASGAGRNLAPDNPAGRVASGFSALDPASPQVFTEGEHRVANREAIGNVVSGFGNTVQGALGTVYSPLNAAFRTYVGQPVERATGSKELGTAAELAAGFFGPSALTRVAQKVGRTIAAKPSADEIQAAATAGFQSPVVRGLEVRSAPVQTWSQTLRADLTRAGLDDIRAADTWRTLARLDNAPAGGAVTGNNLQSLRMSLAETAKARGPDFQPTPDAAAATRAIRSLDDFVAGGIGPRDVIRGNPTEAAATWAEARANYAQYAKIRAADRRQIQAEGNTGSAHSGLNYDNTMRQKMRDIATGPAGRGFTGPGEREAVERVVQGSPERNFLRVTSGAMGGGGGLGALASGSAAGFGGGLGWAGAAVPAAGMALRIGQNALTARDMDRLNAVLRANAPLANGPTQGVARGLMGADLPDWIRNAVAMRMF